ncbi:MAG: hypothetical protein ACREP8_13935 [Candidatus Binatia bacterium]
MKSIVLTALVLFAISVAIAGCGRKEESPQEKSQVEQAVKEAVTKELKMYEGAKQALEKIEKETQERREKELEAK